MDSCSKTTIFLDGHLNSFVIIKMKMCGQESIGQYGPATLYNGAHSIEQPAHHWTVNTQLYQSVFKLDIEELEANVSSTGVDVDVTSVPIMCLE